MCLTAFGGVNAALGGRRDDEIEEGLLKGEQSFAVVKRCEVEMIGAVIDQNLFPMDQIEQGDGKLGVAQPLALLLTEKVEPARQCGGQIVGWTVDRVKTGYVGLYLFQPLGIDPCTVDERADKMTEQYDCDRDAQQDLKKQCHKNPFFRL